MLLLLLDTHTLAIILQQYVRTCTAVVLLCCTHCLLRTGTWYTGEVYECNGGTHGKSLCTECLKAHLRAPGFIDKPALFLYVQQY